MRPTSISTRSSQDARGLPDAAVVTPADRHQPLADIGAGRHPHAQALRRILMHEAPVGAEQKAPLGLAETGKIPQHAVAHAIRHRAPLSAQAASPAAATASILPEPDSPTIASTSPE